MSERAYGPHPLGSAIKRINEHFRDASVVLVTIIGTKDGEPLSTFSEGMQSVAQADQTLMQPEKYVAKVLQQQIDMLVADTTYTFTIVEYVPMIKEIHRIFHGIVHTQNVH